MKELVATCNVYIAEQSAPNARLLGDIAQYLTHLFHVFGVGSHDASIGFSVEGAQAANQVRKRRERKRRERKRGGRRGWGRKVKVYKRNKMT